MRHLLVAGSVAGALVLALSACTGDPGRPDAEPTAEPSPAPTSLTQVDVGALPVVRTAFCESVDPAAVEAALDAPVARTAHYSNGERARLTADVRDVAHENGCTFLADDGARARTWLFVPPVTPESAEDLVTSAEETDRCRTLPGAGAYGDPSTALICGAEGGDRRTQEVSYRGLFGDAWLGCSLSVPAARDADVATREELLARADAWCLEAATAAAT